MYTFNYINQLYIVFDTHHTYILSSFSMINTSLFLNFNHVHLLMLLQEAAI